ERALPRPRPAPGARPRASSKPDRLCSANAHHSVASGSCSRVATTPTACASSATSRTTPAARRPRTAPHPNPPPSRRRRLVLQSGHNSDGMRIERNLTNDSRGSTPAIGIQLDATSDDNVIKKNQFLDATLDVIDDGASNCWQG